MIILGFSPLPLHIFHPLGFLVWPQKQPLFSLCFAPFCIRNKKVSLVFHEVPLYDWRCLFSWIGYVRLLNAVPRDEAMTEMG